MRCVAPPDSTPRDAEGSAWPARGIGDISGAPVTLARLTGILGRHTGAGQPPCGPAGQGDSYLILAAWGCREGKSTDAASRQFSCGAGRYSVGHRNIALVIHRKPNIHSNRSKSE